MRCQKAEKLIILRDADELSFRKVAALEAHLSTCSSCREFAKLMTESTRGVNMSEEPSVRAVQNVLRAARQRAPAASRSVPLLMLKPALGFTAAIMIGLAVFSQYGGTNTETVVPAAASNGMVLVVNDTQFLEPADQVIDVMYSGLSNEDLAFNFLMTYVDAVPEE
ncbi:MAG: zf-HC2 domain-containing protein [Pontiellaceae bacterium]|nr:zf-HC2 domain-containing protein [Pontiellaceae bacterium]